MITVDPTVSSCFCMIPTYSYVTSACLVFVDLICFFFSYILLGFDLTMDDTIFRKLGKVVIGADNSSCLPVDDEDIQEGIKECNLSAVAYLFGMNVRGMPLRIKNSKKMIDELNGTHARATEITAESEKL